MAKRTMTGMGVVLLALLAAGTGSAAAQEGGIAGVVTDDTGASCPG